MYRVDLRLDLAFLRYRFESRVYVGITYNPVCVTSKEAPDPYQVLQRVLSMSYYHERGFLPVKIFANPVIIKFVKMLSTRVRVAVRG